MTGDPDRAPSGPTRPTGSAELDMAPSPGLVPRIAQTGSIPAVRPAAASRRSRRVAKRLRVDWPQCKAHGLCHELLPELIGRDEWGYPVVWAQGVRPALLDDARRAVAACPTLALRLLDPDH